MKMRQIVLLVLVCFVAEVASSEKFRDFVAHDKSWNCTKDVHATPFNKQVRGTNLGGWLVLEPWITPSLFYQFLNTQGKYGDDAPAKTGMDSYTFCTALGKEEANRQLRIHWKKWVTEADFIKLASFGVNSLRIPVGDWMFSPYEPFIGCSDGAVEELDRAINLAHKYKIDVLIDIHAMRGSQNGFDNSGHAHSVKWTSIASSLPIGTTTFSHWPNRIAEWVGTFNPDNRNYSSINHENIQHSLNTIEAITTRYKDHPALLGIQPVNEPWELTPIDLLKDFYWRGYKIVKKIAPSWKYVMHDSFRFGVPIWGGFMRGCPDIALDTHIYQAWNNPGSKEDFFSNACQQKYVLSKMEEEIMPVIVGEWSLATDNCCMWLNGFNDNLPGFPKLPCHYIPCGESYLTKDKKKKKSTRAGSSDFPGLPLDVSKPIQGPYGTGVSGPSFGKCPVTSIDGFDIKDHDMFRFLALKKLNAFNIGHGWYFWNFKAELDAKWDFIRSVENGWLPKNVSSLDPATNNACLKEDKGEFVCKTKPSVSLMELKSGLAFACGSLPELNCTLLNETYNHDIVKLCDYVFDQYWHTKRIEGATCDFGGAAQLQMPSNASLPRLMDHISVSANLHHSDATNTISLRQVPSSAYSSSATAAFAVVCIGLVYLGIISLNKLKRRINYLPMKQ